MPTIEFTETPVEELEPLEVERNTSAAAELLRRVTPEAVTAAAETTVPNYGFSYIGNLIRVYGYLLALHFRIQREPDIDLATLRAEIAAHRAPLNTNAVNFDGAYQPISGETERAILNWFSRSYDLTNGASYPTRDSLIAGIRTAVDQLWPLAAKLDEELLGITGSDGGTTP